MRIYEMKLAGTINKKTAMPIAFATIHRVPGSDTMTVTIHPPSPTSPDADREHIIEVSNTEDVWSMAECLQYHLDGYRGTNSDIHGYYRILGYFMD